MKNLLRKLGLPIVALSMMLQANCSRMLDSNLIVNLPEGPKTYSIQIRNNLVGDLNNPEAGDMWINWGETRDSFELNPGQSYLFQAVGFDVNFPYEGGLELLRYYSNEKYNIWAKPGETYTIDFTMPEEPVIIGFY